jgi:hypothetical protein
MAEFLLVIAALCLTAWIVQRFPYNSPVRVHFRGLALALLVAAANRFETWFDRRKGEEE